MQKLDLTRYAKLSVVAAIVTIGLKAGAWRITGSVGFLSDAMESVVNLIGALMALAMLTIASRPADEEHAYGHSKAEYFSSGVEGTLILLAALSIAWAAGRRLLHPQHLEEVGVGLVVSTVASVVNLTTALTLFGVAKRHSSITLEANARHLFTDVWTSGGVIAAIGLVALTGWEWLDPVTGLAVAANIVWSGFGIIRRSVAGLMDTALPTEERHRVQAVLAAFEKDGVQFHALRTRQAGARRFVSLHVLVPGDWTVQRGHRLLEKLEREIRGQIPETTVFTHLESLDDPSSWEDQKLDR